jgi:16S rRNA (guanine1516-N2)-methyltransferase
MTDQQPTPRIRVEALDPAYESTAASWAARLQLTTQGEAEYALQVGASGVQFVELGPLAAGPVRVDFVEGAVAHRRLFGGGSGQMIAKAVGIQAGVRPRVLDATAGLGRDAFVLAELGCGVTLIERQPLIAALLEDGLLRAQADPEVAPIVARMCLLCGNAIELMAPGQASRRRSFISTRCSRTATKARWSKRKCACSAHWPATTMTPRRCWRRRSSWRHIGW